MGDIRGRGGGAAGGVGGQLQKPGVLEPEGSQTLEKWQTVECHGGGSPLQPDCPGVSPEEAGGQSISLCDLS